MGAAMAILCMMVYPGVHKKLEMVISPYFLEAYEFTSAGSGQNLPCRRRRIAAQN